MVFENTILSLKISQPNTSFTVSDFLVASAIFLGKIAATAEKSLRHNGFCTYFVAVIFPVAVADCERFTKATFFLFVGLRYT